MIPRDKFLAAAERQFHSIHNLPGRLVGRPDNSLLSLQGHWTKLYIHYENTLREITSAITELKPAAFLANLENLPTVSPLVAAAASATLPILYRLADWPDIGSPEEPMEQDPRATVRRELLLVDQAEQDVSYALVAFAILGHPANYVKSDIEYFRRRAVLRDRALSSPPPQHFSILNRAKILAAHINNVDTKEPASLIQLNTLDQLVAPLPDFIHAVLALPPTKNVKS